MAAQNVAFCVFFFSRVGKNQWARVTRNNLEKKHAVALVMIKLNSTRPTMWCISSYGNEATVDPILFTQNFEQLLTENPW